MHSLLLAQTHISTALALLAATNDQLKPCTADQVDIAEFDVRKAVERAHNAADLVVDQLEAIHATLAFSQENGMGDDEPKIAEFTERCFVACRNAMVAEREKLLSDIFSPEGMIAEFTKRRSDKSDASRAVQAKADEIAKSLKSPRAVGRDVNTGQIIFEAPKGPPFVLLQDFERAALGLQRSTQADIEVIKSLLACDLYDRGVLIVSPTKGADFITETDEEREKSDRKVGLKDALEHQRDSGDETKHDPAVININIAGDGKAAASEEKIRAAVDEIKAKATAQPELPAEVAAVVDMLKSMGLKVGQVHVIKDGKLPF